MFQPDLPSGNVTGVLHLNRQSLRFVGGGHTEELSAEHLEVEWSAAEQAVYFLDPERPDWRLRTLDQRVFNVPVFPQLAELRDQLGRERGQREVRRSLRLTLYFALGFVLLATGFSWATGRMVEALAARMPPEWESEIGAEMLTELLAQNPAGGYTNQEAELTRLAAPLVAVLPPGHAEVRFHLVQESDPNAFALPGGDVVVTTGLLALTDQPGEILGVLAHELAHVSRHHHARQLLSGVGSFTLFGVFLGGRGGLSGLLAESSGMVVIQGFSRQFETEADDAGWDFLLAAKIDPRGLPAALAKLQVAEAAGQAGKRRGPAALRSHPDTTWRVQRLTRRGARLAANREFLPLTNAWPRLPEP